MKPFASLIVLISLAVCSQGLFLGGKAVVGKLIHAKLGLLGLGGGHGGGYDGGHYDGGYDGGYYGGGHGGGHKLVLLKVISDGGGHEGGYGHDHDYGYGGSYGGNYGGNYGDYQGSSYNHAPAPVKVIKVIHSNAGGNAYAGSSYGGGSYGGGSYGSGYEYAPSYSGSYANSDGSAW